MGSEPQTSNHIIWMDSVWSFIIFGDLVCLVTKVLFKIFKHLTLIKLLKTSFAMSTSNVKKVNVLIFVPFLCTIFFFLLQAFSFIFLFFLLCVFLINFLLVFNFHLYFLKRFLLLLSPSSLPQFLLFKFLRISGAV